MTEQTVTLKLVADSGQLVGQLRVGKDAIGGFGEGAGKAGTQVRQLGQDSAQLGRSVSAVQQQVRALVGTLSAGLIARQTIANIAGFQQSMAGVRAVTSASVRDMAEMKSAARELGATTKFSASEAAEGMRFLGMAGFETKTIVAAMPAVLDLAASAQLGLAEASDITSNIMSAFNVKAERSSEIADALAVAAASANTDVRQMGEAMRFVGPVAAALKVSMQDSAAAVGALSNAGIQGGAAGTGLRRVLSELASPSKAAKDAIAALGLTLDQVSPKSNSLVDILKRLRDGGLSAEQAFQIFGDRGAPAILALTSQIPELEKLTAKINDSEGAARSMAATLNDTLKGDWLAFVSVLQEVTLQIGDAGVTGAMRSFLQESTEFIRFIAGASAEAAKARDNIKSLSVVIGALFIASRVGPAVNALTASIYAQAAASLAARNAALGMGVAVQTYTVRAIAATAASRALTASLAFVGGPAGAALLAGAGIYYLATRESEAEKQTRRLREEVDQLATGLVNLSDTAARIRLDAVREELKTVEEAIAVTEQQLSDAFDRAGKDRRGGFAGDAAIFSVIGETSVLEGKTKGLTDRRRELFELEGRLSGQLNRSTEDAKAATTATEEFEGATGAANDEVQKAIDRLREQALLIGAVTNLEKVRISISAGLYGQVTPKQREELEYWARIVDAKEADAEAEKALKTAAEERQRIYERNQQQIRETIAALEGEYGALISGADAERERTRATLEAQDATREQIETILDLKDALSAINELQQFGINGESLSFDDAVDLSKIFRDLDRLENAFKGIGAQGERAFRGIADAAKLFTAATKLSGGEAFAAYTEGAAAALTAAQTFSKEGSEEYERLGVAIQALHTVTAVQAALNAFATAPFPANFAALGAALLAVASLGVSIGGAGGVSEPGFQRQTGNLGEGTGTVLGDPTAQSESIKRSLEQLVSLEDSGLDVSRKMLQSLQLIEASIGNVGNTLIRLNVLNGGATPFNRSSTSTPTRIASFVTDQTRLAIAGLDPGTEIMSFLGRQIGGAVGEVLAAPAQLVGDLLGSISSGLFGRTTISQVASGLAFDPSQTFGDVQAGGLDAEYFATIRKKKKSWLGSKTKEWDEFAPLEDALGSQLTALVLDIGDTVLQAVDLLGLDVEAARERLMQTAIGIDRINLQDLTGDEIQELLGSVFSAVADNFATAAAPIIAEFAEVGEGAFETLIRVASQTYAVTAALDRLGISLDAIKDDPLAAARTVQDLIDIAGGVDRLTDSINSFYENFTDEQQKFSDLQSSLGAQLTELGSALPATREGFADLVRGIDITTDAGKEAFVALTALSEAAGAYYSELKRRERERLELIGSVQDALDEMDMSALSISLRDIDRQMREQLDTARELGASERELDLIRTYAARQSARVIDDEAQRMRQTFEQLADAISRTQASIAADIQRIRQSAPGYDLAGYQSGRIAELRHQLPGADAQTQISLIGDIRSAITARYDAEVAAIQAAARAQEQAQAQAAQAQQQAAQDARRSWEEQQRAAQQLRDYVAQLGLSQVSPLTAQQRLAEAEQLYNQALTGRDAGALQQSAEQYLQELRAVYGVSDIAVEAFERVRGELGDRASQLGSAREPVFQSPQLQSAMYGVQGSVIDVDAQIARLRDAAIAELQDLEAHLAGLRDSEEATLDENIAEMRARYDQADGHHVEVMNLWEAQADAQQRQHDAELAELRKQNELLQQQIVEDRENARVNTQLLETQQRRTEQLIAENRIEREATIRAIHNMVQQLR